MDTSIFIAKLFGTVYLVIGIGILLNAGYYRNMLTQFTESAVVTYLGGAMALVFGLLIVMFHNVWVGSWEVIITILGWLALLKGVVLLVQPEFAIKHAQVWASRMQFAGIFATVIGAILVYYGWFA